MILINNNGVFIDGNHTTNPVLIGYAVLDYAESIKELEKENELKLQDELSELGKRIYETQNFNVQIVLSDRKPFGE